MRCPSCDQSGGHVAECPCEDPAKMRDFTEGYAHGMLGEEPRLRSNPTYMSGYAVGRDSNGGYYIRTAGADA